MSERAISSSLEGDVITIPPHDSGMTAKASPASPSVTSIRISAGTLLSPVLRSRARLWSSPVTAPPTRWRNTSPAEVLQPLLCSPDFALDMEPLGKQSLYRREKVMCHIRLDAPFYHYAAQLAALPLGYGMCDACHNFVWPVHHTPVDPNPPSPRAGGGSSSTTSISTRATGTTTS